MRALDSIAAAIRAVLVHPALPYALGLLSALLILPALWAGFQMDDHFQRFRLLGLGDPAIRLFEFYDGDPVRNRLRMDWGNLPWWTAEDLRHKNFRYLSVLTMQLDFALWPERPALMHLHSFLWLGALIVAATWLYRGLMGVTWTAGLAALLYAVEDAHAAPVAYLANRNAVIATCLGVLCLVCYERWRREGWRAGAVWSPILFALALSAAEIGIATAAYLASYAFFVERDAWSRRLIALAPCVAVALVWAAIYATFGFGASGSGFYTNPLGDPLGFLGLFTERAPLLLLGQWTPVPADLALVSDPTLNSAAGLRRAGLVVVAVLAVLMGPLLARDRVARFWCAGALLSLLPISATGPQNRLLFFVGIGSMGLLAMFVDDVISARKKARPLAWRWPAGIVACLLLVVHVLLAPPVGLLTLQAQRDADRRLRQALATVPEDPTLADQDLILVNPPDHTYTVGVIPFFKRTQGAPAPRRMRALSVGASPLQITRVDAHTLDLRLEYGLFSTPISRYFRSAERGMAVGDRFEVADLEIEILALKSPGDPLTLRYRFAVPLEDPSLRWLRWQDRVYVPWSPPSLGESVELLPGRGIFDLD